MRGRTSISILRRSSARSRFNRSRVQKFKRDRREDNEHWLDGAYVVVVNRFDWRAGERQISRAALSVVRKAAEIHRRCDAFCAGGGTPDRRKNPAWIDRERS